MADIRSLKEHAIRAAARAYCPYSHFHVGAAVLDVYGNIYAGANIENASYGLTLCAERAALSRAVIIGAGKILAIAIACPDASEDPWQLAERVPCGACRQWLAELAPDAKIYIVGIDREFTLDDFLPNPFTLKGDSDELA